MLQTNTLLKPVSELRQRIPVPLADLRAQYNSLRSEMIATVLEVMGIPKPDLMTGESLIGK